HHALALDDARVAKARLFTRTAPVDERDRAAALVEMERRGHANHAGAKHDDIGVAGTVQVPISVVCRALGRGGVGLSPLYDELALDAPDRLCYSLCPTGARP